MFRIKRSTDGRFYATVELKHDIIFSTSDTFYHKKSAWLWIFKKIEHSGGLVGYYVKDLTAEEEINYLIDGFDGFTRGLPFSPKIVDKSDLL